MVQYEKFASQMRPLCVPILERLRQKNTGIQTEHIQEVTYEALGPLMERQDVWFQVV